MHCLFCDQYITIQVDWRNLFLPRLMNGLCDQCEEKLEKLTGPRCSYCSRMSADAVCQDCIWWQRRWSNDDPLDGNRSVYTYSEMMQKMIAKWKYRGDYVIGHTFRDTFVQDFRRHFRKWKNPVAVPIPLSEERLRERGFNQAQMLATFLPAELNLVLSRNAGEKQSKKTRKQRLSAQNPFQVNSPINKPVILVDDIYTTGTTLRHAASILKKHGCPEVSAYTLIRG